MNTQNKADYGYGVPADKLRHDARHGFTLVEILVVLVVIGVLAALLMPVISRAREAGRRTACTSNMRQMGMAFQQYMQDNSNKLPIAVDGGFGVDEAYAWTYYSKVGSGNNTSGDDHVASFDPSKGSLFQYVKSQSVYVCPSDSEARTSQQSYAINSCAFSKATPEAFINTAGDPADIGHLGSIAGSVRLGKSQVRFRNPAEWMLLGEEERDPSRAGLTSTDDAYLNLRDTRDSAQFESYQNYFSPRHSGGSIITFLDGHSKWYSVENILKNRFQIGGPNIDPSKTLDNGCPEGVQ